MKGDKANNAEVEGLLGRVRGCATCADLPLGPKPIVQLSPTVRLLIISQAPGRRAHASGLPFDDPSGDRLRDWMGVSREQFYDSSVVGIMPMGFCFPGTGRSGDLPPRAECARQWHDALLSSLAHEPLKIVIGAHAQKRYFPECAGDSLTRTVQRYRAFLPGRLPLPHPSPRNQFWLKRNPWFEATVLPVLREHVRKAFGQHGNIALNS